MTLFLWRKHLKKFFYYKLYEVYERQPYNVLLKLSNVSKKSREPLRWTSCIYTHLKIRFKYLIYSTEITVLWLLKDLLNFIGNLIYIFETFKILRHNRLITDEKLIHVYRVQINNISELPVTRICGFVSKTNGTKFIGLASGSMNRKIAKMANRGLLWHRPISAG